MSARSGASKLANPDDLKEGTGTRDLAPSMVGKVAKDRRGILKII